MSDLQPARVRQSTQRRVRLSTSCTAMGRSGTGDQHLGAPGSRPPASRLGNVAVIPAGMPHSLGADPEGGAMLVGMAADGHDVIKLAPRSSSGA